MERELDYLFSYISPPPCRPPYPQPSWLVPQMYQQFPPSQNPKVLPINGRTLWKLLRVLKNRTLNIFELLYKYINILIFCFIAGMSFVKGLAITR